MPPLVSRCGWSYPWMRAPIAAGGINSTPLLSRYIGQRCRAIGSSHGRACRPNERQALPTHDRHLRCGLLFETDASATYARPDRQS